MNAYKEMGKEYLDFVDITVRNDGLVLRTILLNRVPTSSSWTRALASRFISIHSLREHSMNAYKEMGKEYLDFVDITVRNDGLVPDMYEL